MFEGLRQDIRYLAGEAGRSVSSLAERVRAAIPQPDVNLYQQSNGTGTVAFSLGSHRWQFDVSQRATYVLGNARSVFRRITGEPETVERQRSRARPRIPASLERCFDPTQERNAPAIAAQMASSDPVVRGSGETAFRELIRHHPQAAAQAVNHQRQASAAQGVQDQVARLDQSVHTATHAVITQPTASRSLATTGRSCVTSFTASLQASPLKTQVLALIRVTPPTHTPSATPSTLTLASFPTRVRDAAVGAYPGVFMACVRPEVAEAYGAHSRTFTPGFSEAPLGQPHQPASPDLLGALPITPTTPFSFGGEVTPPATSTTPFITNTPVLVAVRRPDGQIVYVPQVFPEPHLPTPAPRETLVSNFQSSTQPAPVNPQGIPNPTLTITANDNAAQILPTVRFVAVNDNGRPSTSDVMTVSHHVTALPSATPRPRRSDPAALTHGAFAGLFTDATPANDGPRFVSPAQAGFVVPEQVAFTKAQGAPISTATGGANPSVAMRGELHEGRGNGGGNSGGRDEGGEGERQQDQRDRRQQQEEAREEAVA